MYFCAGAGGKGGDEGTRKVDYEGAVKVFDAIEGVRGDKPRLILISSVDVRDPEKVPAHYVCCQARVWSFHFRVDIGWGRTNKILRFQRGIGRRWGHMWNGNMRRIRIWLRGRCSSGRFCVRVV